MKYPQVSVVMVARNVDRFLAEAIESILTQTFRDFEFVIVDFGSEDKSKSIVSNYAAQDRRIKFHEIPACSLVTARNASCSFARGKYIAIMDADDVSVPDRLALEVAFMEKHPKVGVLGGLTNCINAAGESLGFGLHYLPAGDQEIKAALAVRCSFCQPSVLIRRAAFELVGGYREAFAPAEDYDLWLRIAEQFQCAGLQQVVLNYRIHPHQLSIQKQWQQTLGLLGAQASASLRISGRPDPLDSITEITPAVLADLGVTEARQRSELATNFLNWSRTMCKAGEHCAALDAALTFLRSDLKCVERRKIAELYLIVAGLHWRRKRLLSSCFALGRALLTRPILAGRPVKLLLHRAGLAQG